MARVNLHNGKNIQCTTDMKFLIVILNNLTNDVKLSLR